MAQRQYDLVVKDDKVSLTEAAGASIGGSAIRITIDDANMPSKADVIRLLKWVEARIIEDTWPPS
jgi:hypothetical protein